MKKNGFTLIELLAVILILGIIALIAIPTVNKLVLQSKKAAFETSVKNVADAIEDKCEEQSLTGSSLTKSYSFIDSTVTPKVDVKRQIPNNGKILVDNNCHTKISVSNKKYIATKEYDDEKIIITDGSVAPDISLPNDDNCFIFDSSSKTITGYNFNNSSCGTDIVIPSEINNVTVENIGRSAFTVATSGTKIIDLCTDVDCNNVYEEIYSDSKDYSSYANYSWYYTDLSLDSNLHCISNDYSTWTTKSSEYVHVNGDGYAACLFQGNDYKSIITSVVLPNTLKVIKSSAFAQNKLTSIRIPNSVTTIESTAFSYNTGLTSLILGNSLKVIQNSAFAKCSLSELVIPSSVTTIGNSAFFDNVLESVTLKEGLLSIGNAAFHGNLLKTITIPSTVNSIDILSLSNNQLETIYNKTGKSFDWNAIIDLSNPGACTYATGNCFGITIAN